MKIRISTVIEIPDEELIKGRELDCARQIIFDGITNYVTRRHGSDVVMLWEHKNLVNIHKNWFDICKKLDWKYEKVEN